MNKYERQCFFCKGWFDEWEITVKEDGVWIRPCCEGCLAEEKSQPLPGTVVICNGRKREQGEERRAEGDSSAPLPGNQLKLFRR